MASDRTALEFRFRGPLCRFIRPKIGRVNDLSWTWDDADFWKVKFEPTDHRLFPIHDYCYCVSVAHPGCVDLWFPRKNVPVAASDVASCLLRNWVLISCDQTAVHENGKGFGTNVIEIGSDDQGGFGKCPQCKMCLLFLKSKAIVTFTVMNANLKHVRIVPTSHATCLRMLLTFFEVVLDWSPAIEDVLGGAPRVTCFKSPLPGLVFSPVANRIENRAAGSQQSIPHGWVSNSTADAVIVTIIVF